MKELLELLEKHIKERLSELNETKNDALAKYATQAAIWEVKEFQSLLKQNKSLFKATPQEENKFALPAVGDEVPAKANRVELLSLLNDMSDDDLDRYYREWKQKVSTTPASSVGVDWALLKAFMISELSDVEERGVMEPIDNIISHLQLLPVSSHVGEVDWNRFRRELWQILPDAELVNKIKVFCQQYFKSLPSFSKEDKGEEWVRVKAVKEAVYKHVPCLCDEGYKSRDLTDPFCPQCNYADEVLIELKIELPSPPNNQ